jgi:hypothetical protein
MRWTRLNQVERAEPPHKLAWRTVARFAYLDSVEWHLELDEEGKGTRVTEGFQILRLSQPMEGVLHVAMPVHCDRSADLAADLDRLKFPIETD